jgi:hypothetical protein
VTRLFHGISSYDGRLLVFSPSKFGEHLKVFQAHLTKSSTFKHPRITFSQNRSDSSVPPVPSSYPHFAKSTDITMMSPKAAAASGKDDSAKRVKDLELLLTCLKTFPNVIQVDYEELSKEIVKQGDNINIAAAYVNARHIRSKSMSS